jgi:multiple sugar transport system permease protein
MRKKNKEALTGYLFVTPALTVFFIFVFFSILFIVGLSFTKYNTLSKEIKFIGLDNYIRLFKDIRFHIALKNTLKYVAIVVPIQTILSLLIAIALNAKIKYPTVFRTIFFLPTLTSSAVLTVIFMFLFSINGPVNHFLLDYNFINTPINFLTDTKFTLNVIMIMNIWSTVPFFATIYIAGLQDISQEMYEAAQIDGANGLKRFIYIIIPMMTPITLFVFLTGIIGCFQVFDQAYIFSGGTGGPANSTLTVTLLIYQYAFNTSGTMGYASTIAVVLSVIIFAVSAITKKWQNGGDE